MFECVNWLGSAASAPRAAAASSAPSLLHRAHLLSHHLSLNSLEKRTHLFVEWFCSAFHDSLKLGVGFEVVNSYSKYDVDVTCLSSLLFLQLVHGLHLEHLGDDGHLLLLNLSDLLCNLNVSQKLSLLHLDFFNVLQCCLSVQWHIVWSLHLQARFMLHSLCQSLHLSTNFRNLFCCLTWFVIEFIVEIEKVKKCVNQFLLDIAWFLDLLLGHHGVCLRVWSIEGGLPLCLEIFVDTSHEYNL